MHAYAVHLVVETLITYAGAIVTMDVHIRHHRNEPRVTPRCKHVDIHEPEAGRQADQKK